MRLLYEAEHVLDAYLVRNALAEIEIPAFVSGEHLTGAMGELPAMGLVKVWVPDSALPAASACLRELGLGADGQGQHKPAEDDPGFAGEAWLPA